MGVKCNPKVWKRKAESFLKVKMITKAEIRCSHKPRNAVNQEELKETKGRFSPEVSRRDQPS